MAQIYLCDVQFITKQHKEKKPVYGQTEKLVLNLSDEGEILFKDYEMIKKHRDTITPTSKTIILDMKLIKKVVYLGETVFNISEDRRNNYNYKQTYENRNKKK